MSTDRKPQSVYTVEHTSPTEGVFSLPGALNALLSHWRVFVTIPVVLVLTVATLLLLKEREYEATLSFVPQADAGLRGGLMSGVAAQFGVDIGGGSSTEDPAFFAELVRSTAILRPMVDTRVTVTDQRGRSVEAPVGELIGVETTDDAEGRRALMGALRARIDASVDRSTGTVRVAVSAPRPEFAVAIADRVLELVLEFNTTSRRSKAVAEREFLEARVSEAQRDLGETEDALRVFMERNATWEESPTLRMEAGRLQRAVTLRQQVFTSLSQALEDAKIEEIRTTPVLTLVEEPADTVKPLPRRTIYWLAITLITGLAIAVGLVLAWESLRDQFARHPEDAADIRRTVRRWLGSSGGPVHGS